MTLVPLISPAQQKPLSHDVYDSWMQITGEAISRNGRYVLYTLEPGEGDARLVVMNTRDGKTDTIARGTGATFMRDSRFAVFTIRPLFAAIKKARDEKKKAEESPKDSLGILNLETHEVQKVARVRSFKVPEKGTGWVAYQMEAPMEDSLRAAKKGKHDAADETAGGTAAEKGTTVFCRELATGREFAFPSARDYELSRNGARLMVTTTGSDSNAAPGVFVFTTATKSRDTIATGRGTYRQPAWNEDGSAGAFLADRDTSKARQRYYGLWYWRAGKDTAQLLADTLTAGMYRHWLVSENARPWFSRDSKRLFFGTAPVPVPDDTSLIEAETPRLDVWTWTDPVIQPAQLKNLDEEKKRSYSAVMLLQEMRIAQLADTTLPSVTPGDEGTAPLALGLSSLPYRREETWEGTPSYDVFAVNVETGARTRLLTKIQGGASLSPGGKYITWYDRARATWCALPLAGGSPVNLTAAVHVPVYDELNDVPAKPGPYGAAGWTSGDSVFLVYDRYDIWAADPAGTSPARCVTEGSGRRAQIRYRYVRLDPDERFLRPGAMMLLRAFREKDKSAGFARTIVGSARAPEMLALTPHIYPTVARAAEADAMIFTRENFRECPDLYLTDTTLASPARISDSNPQQKEYLWGNVELVHWKAADGKPLEGLLYTPPGFDRKKKYPMIVYYYERTSDYLHNYVAPAPSRSIINFSLYASRGYLLFVPDIRYRVGHPGQSAYDCVIPGVRALIAKGFVDAGRMGLQGHSWGGYETAFLVTRTHMFRAAEAGAAVANMTSAYDGIRWESGIARIFQYEQEQSRIGATLWQRPDLYIENSPLFRADSITTPLLLMNNDADGAVPWYQGIEFYNALRRLGKPAWMLVYNGEAHGLVQRKNRKDFSIRMMEFFDYYLMGKTEPPWMKRGLPAILKGKTLGY